MTGYLLDEEQDVWREAGVNEIVLKKSLDSQLEGILKKLKEENNNGHEKN